MTNLDIKLSQNERVAIFLSKASGRLSFFERALSSAFSGGHKAQLRDYNKSFQNISAELLKNFPELSFLRLGNFLLS